MTRLTERETEEIRRAKRAVESEAQQQESRTRFADPTPTPGPTPEPTLGPTPEPMQDPALQVLMARPGRLAILYNIMLRALLVRRTVKELRGLSDHLLWDIGIDRSQVELVAKGLVDRMAPAPRSESRLLAALRRRRSQHRAIRDLSRLSDHHLKDIGLARAEIPEVVERLYRAEEGQQAAKRESLQVALRTPSPLHAMRQWNPSRQAANEMVRLDPDIYAGLADRKLATG